MIRPVVGSPAFAFARQWAAAKWHVPKWPLRWTRMTSSHVDSSMLNDILSRRMPALLTTMSRAP